MSQGKFRSLTDASEIKEFLSTIEINSYDKFYATECLSFLMTIKDIFNGTKSEDAFAECILCCREIIAKSEGK